MSSLRSLWPLYLTRLREFYRQPARIFWVYGFPIIMALVLGLAFRNRGPAPTPVLVVSGEGSKTILGPLDGDPRFRFEVVDAAAADRRLRTGKAVLVAEGTTGRGVVYHLDPTRPEAVAARSGLDDALQRASGRRDVVESRSAEVREVGSRYIDFLIPGLIGANTMGGGLWGVGFLIVNFRTAKLLKRFRATPMPRSNFLLAILLARLTFLIPDCATLLLFGKFVFGMPIRGSLATVALIELLGGLAFAGIGLLVACRARTTESVSGLMNLVMLPMWLLSGVVFSSENFPAPLQPVIRALPLTQLVGALRAVILEGAGVADPLVAAALAILAAWAAVTFGLALRFFRWQ